MPARVASSAIAANANMNRLKRVMGHSSMAIAYAVYGHPLPNSLDELGAELDKPFA